MWDFLFPMKNVQQKQYFFSMSQCQAQCQQKTAMNKKCWKDQCLSYETLGQIQYYSQIFNVLPWEAERWLLGNLLFCLLF